MEYPIKVQIAFDPNPTASAWKELHLSFCIYNPNNRLGQPGITGAGSLHLQKKRTEMHKVCRQFQKDFRYQSLEWSLHQVKQSLTNGCQADVNQLF
jgi:hypothetical protein